MNVDLGPAFLVAAGVDADHRLGGIAVFPGVRDDVYQHLQQPVRIGDDRQMFGDRIAADGEVASCGASPGGNECAID